MGIIVDANSDHEAEDSWAIITGTTVSNTIVASYNTIVADYQDNYDYLVDLTVGEQGAGPGYTYDPENDTFSPPAVDYAANLKTDLNALCADLAQALSDAGQLDSETLAATLSDATDEQSSGFTTNEADLFAAICDYITNGG